MLAAENIEMNRENVSIPGHLFFNPRAMRKENVNMRLCGTDPFTKLGEYERDDIAKTSLKLTRSQLSMSVVIIVVHAFNSRGSDESASKKLSSSCNYRILT